MNSLFTGLAFYALLWIAYIVVPAVIGLLCKTIGILLPFNIVLTLCVIYWVCISIVIWRLWLRYYRSLDPAYKEKELEKTRIKLSNQSVKNFKHYQKTAPSKKLNEWELFSIEWEKRNKTKHQLKS